MTKSRQWALGTALVVALVLVAGFMLLVQPKRSDAASLKEQTTSQQAANAALLGKIATLKAQQQDLPRQQARLAQIRVQLPEGPNLPSLVRSLTDVSRTTGIDLVALEPSNPVALTLPSAQTSGTAPQPVTPDSAPTAPGVQQIPLKISVLGTYAELTQFLGRLEGLQRSMIVDGVAVAKPTSSAGGAGAIGADELQLDVTARIFMAPAPVPASQTQTLPNQATTPTTGGTASSTSSQ